MMNYENRIIVALDLNDITKAKNIVNLISYDVIYKIGMEFFFSFGIEGIRELKKIKPEIKFFLDLKLHDIPNTVSKSIEPLILKVRPYMFTLHTSGGNIMLKEAVSKVDNICKVGNFKKPILLGVTILTSLKKEDLVSIDWGKDIRKVVIKLARLAESSGLDGIVCSAQEIKDIRKNFNNLKIVAPGIRFKQDNKEDQVRVMSPEEAIKAGADFIVIGRPILNAEDPNLILKNILNSFNSHNEN